MVPLERRTARGVRQTTLHAASCAGPSGYASQCSYAYGRRVLQPDPGCSALAPQAQRALCTAGCLIAMGLSRIHYVALGAVLVVLAVAATLLTAESHAEAELGNNRPSNTLDVEIPGVQHGAGANSQVSGGVTTASNAAASGASSSVPGASSSVPGSSSSAAAHSGSGVSSDGSSSTALTGSGGGNVGGSSDAREGRPSNSGDGGDGGSSGQADARSASGKPAPRADMNTFHLVSAPATFVADKVGGAHAHTHVGAAGPLSCCACGWLLAEKVRWCAVGHQDADSVSASRGLIQGDSWAGVAVQHSETKGWHPCADIIQRVGHGKSAHWSGFIEAFRGRGRAGAVDRVS